MIIDFFLLIYFVKFNLLNSLLLLLLILLFECCWFLLVEIEPTSKEVKIQLVKLGEL